MEKNCSKFYSDASSSSDIDEEIIKHQTNNTLKPFDIELRNAIPRKHFVLEEKNN